MDHGGSVKMYDTNMDEYIIFVDGKEVKMYPKGTHIVTVREILEATDGVSMETHKLVWHWGTYSEVMGVDKEVSVHAHKHFTTVRIAATTV